MNDETLAALQMQMLMFVPCLIEVGIEQELIEKAMQLLEQRITDIEIPNDDIN
jgi:hypothetical protein